MLVLTAVRNRSAWRVVTGGGIVERPYVQLATS